MEFINFHKKEPEFTAKKESINRYEKLKDSSPLDTVLKIQGILSKYNILAAQDWEVQQKFNFAENRTFCLRLVLNGLRNFGTNGKGTNLEYTLASAFGELMERIEAGIMCFDITGYENYSKYLPKTDKLLNTEEFCKLDNSFINKHFIRILDQCYPDKDFPEFDNVKDFVDCLKEKTHVKTDEDFICSQYYSYKEKETLLIPDYMLQRGYVNSNGYSAGNTLEEALVQAFSEVFERHCQQEILMNGYMPPRVPFELYSKYPEIVDIIESYKQSGVDVQIFDASLGKGFPVIMTLYRELSSGKILANFGSHPYLPVAIERTLTEIGQGGNIFSKFWGFTADYFESSYFDKFLYNKISLSFSYVPINPRALKNQSDWNFDNNTFSLTTKNNKEHLKNILKLCEKYNYDIYLKDCSFLNFPVVHVYIPEISHYITNFDVEYLAHSIGQVHQENSMLKMMELLKNNEHLETLYKTYMNSMFYDIFHFQCCEFTYLIIALVAGYKLKKYDDLRAISDILFIKGLNQIPQFMELMEPIRTLIDSREFERLAPFMDRLLNYCYIENQRFIEIGKFNSQNPNKDCSQKNLEIAREKLQESFIEILKTKQSNGVDNSYLKEYFDELMS